MKIAKSHEDSTLLLKSVSETIQNAVKEQKRGFLGMLLCTLGASLLGNMLTDEGIIRAGHSSEELWSKNFQSSQGKGIIRAVYGSKRSLIPLYSLINFEIQKYYQNEPRFKGVYLTKNRMGHI